MNRTYGARRAWNQWRMVMLALLAAFVVAGPLAAAPKEQAATRTVLVMGDSLSAAYGLAASQGWVALTGVRMKQSNPGWRVVNASISGETTAGGAARIAKELKRVHPQIVVIVLGANDGLRGLPLEQTKKNLDSMILRAKAANAEVLLVGMRVPPNYGREYAEAFAANYTDLAKQYDIPLVPFLLAPIALDRASFQDDNLHPVAAAQPKLRDHVWKSLGPMLK